MRDKPDSRLRNEAEAPTLGFGSINNALNLSCHCYEGINSGKLPYRLNIAEGYEKSKFEVVIELSSRQHPACKYHLIFFAIPMGRWDLYGASDCHVTDVNAADSRAHRDQNCVSCVTQLVQGPQGVIPSFVRLERAKKRLDVQRQVTTSASDVVVHVSGSVPKRKLSTLGRSNTADDCGGVPGLIESGSERLKRLSGVVGTDLGERLFQFEFEKLKTVRLFLSDCVAWYRFEERLASFFKFGGVLLAALPPTARTGKGIFGHS